MPNRLAEIVVTRVDLIPNPPKELVITTLLLNNEMK